MVYHTSHPEDASLWWQEVLLHVLFQEEECVGKANNDTLVHYLEIWGKNFK